MVCELQIHTPVFFKRFDYVMSKSAGGKEKTTTDDNSRKGTVLVQEIKARQKDRRPFFF
jgi:hypothetical protein